MTNAKDRVRGLSHFSEYFAAEKNTFVIIGGIAAMFSLESSGIQARATKDIDLVILANPNIAFADKLKNYVREGGYEINVGSVGAARNYRFRKPINIDFPQQVEIFSSTDFDFQLRPGQEIVPIETSSGLGSLSAILMDQDYFSLVQSDVNIVDGIPLLGISALIPLKARAFLDLFERKQKGEAVDSRDIKKHKTDVLKLVAALPKERFELSNAVALDMRRFFLHPEIVIIQKATVRELIGISSSVDELIAIAKNYYGIP